MLKTRVIPCLLLANSGLVKTVKFKNAAYVGDPINTVRIFNELEVDELAFLDIRASVDGTEPNFALLQEIAVECFMPLSYGGGVRSIATAERIFQIGFEKIVINTALFDSETLLGDIARRYGSQSTIVSIDVKRNIWGQPRVMRRSGTQDCGRTPVEWARHVESLGAGEILLTSIDREGTWQGFDVELTAQISQSVSIPVIANGGAGNLEHVSDAVKRGGASAVGLGSMVVYQNKGMGVLVNFPDRQALDRALR